MLAEVLQQNSGMRQIRHQTTTMRQHAQRPAEHQQIEPGQRADDMLGMLRYKMLRGVPLPLIRYCSSQTSLSPGERDAVPTLVAANRPRYVQFVLLTFKITAACGELVLHREDWPACGKRKNLTQIRGKMHAEYADVLVRLPDDGQRV
jgi:hypothetical protein